MSHWSCMGVRPTDTMLIKQNIRVPPIIPYVTSLPGGRDVIIDYLTDDQLEETFQMIQEAAKEGEGFGINEFPNIKEFQKEIEGGHNFGITDKKSKELIAAFVITVSKFYRGSKVADPFIIVRKSERRKGVGEFCLRSALNHAMDLNFIGMYVDCFSNNKGMIKIVENVGGFSRCGFLPMAGQMNDKTFIGSIIFYRDLHEEE
ncbi:hypothetical protein LOTGIDRAFT_237687 [Lottia gigantea]|uniref:N-acetyltransferase domain-containing protein n=1 Tax=Lottia gigantea TaxID=225164 RepID=V4CM54_LOTGI|nr:hypothetical protein LOTGIDRAFT_237687 [Lottia gigantea]ESP03375.1 hypothetical protein LOTGIDRAFT_237687 [Lottia gigantea]